MKRYMRHLAVLAAILTACVLFTAAAPKSQASQTNNQENGKSGEQERLAREAKITLEQAREIALKRAPGNVESSELEREHKRLVYSFDIRNSKGTITEVQVSAINGRVVSVEHENKKQEAKEQQQEKRENKTGRKP